MSNQLEIIRPDSKSCKPTQVSGPWMPGLDETKKHFWFQFSDNYYSMALGEELVLKHFSDMPMTDELVIVKRGLGYKVVLVGLICIGMEIKNMDVMYKFKCKFDNSEATFYSRNIMEVYKIKWYMNRNQQPERVKTMIHI